MSYFEYSRVPNVVTLAKTSKSSLSNWPGYGGTQYEIIVNEGACMQRVTSPWVHWVVGSLVVVILWGCAGKAPDTSTTEEPEVNKPELSLSPLSWLLSLAAPIRPEQPNTVAMIERQAKRFQDQGKYALAEKQYLLAVHMREQAWPSGDLHIAPGLDKVAAFYMARERYDDAEPLLRRALEMREKAVETTPRAIAANLEKLAKLLRKTQREEEAARLETRAQALRSS